MSTPHARRDNRPNAGCSGQGAASLPRATKRSTSACRLDDVGASTRRRPRQQLRRGRRALRERRDIDDQLLQRRIADRQVLAPTGRSPSAIFRLSARWHTICRRRHLAPRASCIGRQARDPIADLPLPRRLPHRLHRHPRDHLTSQIATKNVGSATLHAPAVTLAVSATGDNQAAAGHRPSAFATSLASTRCSRTARARAIRSAVFGNDDEQIDPIVEAAARSPPHGSEGSTSTNVNPLEHGAVDPAGLTEQQVVAKRGDRRFQVQTGADDGIGHRVAERLEHLPHLRRRPLRSCATSGRRTTRAAGDEDVAAIDRRRRLNHVQRSDRRRAPRPRPASPAGAIRRPGRVMIASSSNTIAMSSTNTESGICGLVSSRSTRYAGLDQRLLVGAMLRARPLDVDRDAFEMRQLARRQAPG